MPACVPSWPSARPLLQSRALRWCSGAAAVVVVGAGRPLYERRTCAAHGGMSGLPPSIYTADFKQADWRYSSRPILSFQQWVDGARRIRDWAAGHLDALDRCCTVARCIPTVGFDRGDPATRNRYPLGWLRTLGSYPPRSRQPSHLILDALRQTNNRVRALGHYGREFIDG